MCDPIWHEFPQRRGMLQTAILHLPLPLQMIAMKHIQQHWHIIWPHCETTIVKSKKEKISTLLLIVVLCPHTRTHARTHTHTHTHNRLTAVGLGQPGVGRYQKKQSPTHTHPGHRTSFINFLHLLQSIASSVFSLHAWQSSLTTSLQVLFCLPLGLGPSTSYSMHFFTQHHKDSQLHYPTYCVLGRHKCTTVLYRIIAVTYRQWSGAAMLCWCNIKCLHSEAVPICSSHLCKCLNNIFLLINKLWFHTYPDSISAIIKENVGLRLTVKLMCITVKLT